jgi:hypothetical protein
MKRIKHNNLLPWFTQDHGTLPTSYMASCEKFFKELSGKPQASSLTIAVGFDRMNLERNNYEIKSKF